MREKKDKSELRQDLASGKWVIISTARGKRPHAFFGAPASIKQPKSKCPFENPFAEAEPKEVYLKEGGKNEKKDWSLVVLPNKFPAVFPDILKKETKEGIYRKISGFGFHELFVARDHDKFIPDLSKKEAIELVSSYKKRYEKLSENKNIEYIIIIHNHGKDAGASLRHLHSQLIASPVVPDEIALSMQKAGEYFKKHKSCVYCDVLKYETKAKKRIVYQNKKFVVFVPFAASIAFEMKIFPKEHQASFSEARKEDLEYFADALQESLGKLRTALNDPAFNFFVHSTPTKKKQKHYHWHLEILPKTSVWAGYELGSGMKISAVYPEDAAKFLRNAK